VDRKTEALVDLMNEKESLCAELHEKTENLEKVILEKNAILFRLERLEAKVRVGMGVEECTTGDSTPLDNKKMEISTEKLNSENPKTENQKEGKTEKPKTENQKEGKTEKPKTHSEERITGKNGRNSSSRNKVSFEIDNSLTAPEKLFIQTSGWAREWSSFFWDVVSGRV